MATQRFNYNDKFRLNGKKVGISSASPEENLDVASGTLKGVDLQSNSGITTFSTYEGFLNKKTTYTENVNIDTGVSGSLSGEIVVGAGLTVTVGTAATSGQGDVECLKVFNVFNPPCGGTANRPSAATPGTLYYNKDFRTIEYWDGNFWRQVDYTTASGRAVVTGGVAPGSDYTAAMQLFNIHTLGNATYFGDLSNGGRFCIGRSSSTTRGIIAGGQEGPSTPRDFIDYITIASAGDSQDFGDLSSAGRCFGGASSSTRGIVGCPNASNTANAVEIATLGSLMNTYVNFGLSGGNKTAQFSSPIKLISNSGEGTGTSRGTGSPIQNVTVEQVIIASGGDTTAWGELTRATRQKRGTSNQVRGIFAGGYDNYNPYPNVKMMDYINIESEGVAVHFGDLTEIKNQMACMSSPTRSVFAGGSGTPTTVNTIEYVNMASTGNGQDFGDLTKKVSATNGLSDCHGGLGGF